MKLSHASEESVHAVLASDLCRFREMIYLLISSESLIRLRLDVAAGPHDSVFLIPLRGLPKAVILKQITNKPHFNLIIELKIVAAILRLVRADAYRVDVWAEADVLLIDAILHCWG